MTEEPRTIKPIDTLEVDGQTHQVSDLPENIQKLIEVFNLWRQERVELEDEVKQAQGKLIKQDAALRAANQEIMVAFREWQNPEGAEEKE